MGRLFTSCFQAVTVSAAQDLFALHASSTVPLLIHSCVIGQSSDFGDAQDENLRIRIRRGMTSNGTGGTTPAMNPVDAREATAATATCRANDTTAASGGTIVEMWEETFNVRAGYVWLPTPAMQLTCAVSTRIAFNLPAAPADALTMSGTIVWEEAF
jgi:hypothetical protein